MVTESLHLIGKQRQQQQQQQQEQHREAGKAKQTIVFGTKGINREADSKDSNSSNSSRSVSDKGSEKLGGWPQNIRKTTTTTTRTGDDYSISESSNGATNRLLCRIEARSSPICEDQSASSLRANHLLVDSRSILNNKQRLKRFWELKMELEFKLRQQQVEPVRSASKRTINQHQQANNNNSSNKQVSYDANNNSNNINNNIASNHNNNGDIKSDNNDHTTTKENSSSNKQQLYYSDEEWRSLSPNLDPSSCAGKVKGNFNGVSNSSSNNNNNNNNISNSNSNRPTSKQQVSAELVCEKLREYQAASNVNGQHQEKLSMPARHSTTNGESKPVPKSSATARQNQVLSLNNHSSEEAQLMSIDPSICHSGAREPHDLEESATAAALSGEDGGPDSSNCNSNNNSFNEREEQTFNEEFSSSNSSFGPMSLSIARQDSVPVSDSGSSQVASIAKSCLSDEDDTNSAQSGSVLTVIMKLDHDQNQLSNNNNDATANNTNTTDDLHSQSTAVSSTTCDQTSGSQPDLSSSSSSTLSQPLATQPEVEEAESNSNIGVAFESLHFDSEIKSSKHEQVDEELLRPTPVKRPSVSKFNASEVKSVCSFITAAISDATRQVESYMSKGSSASTAATTATQVQSKPEDEPVSASSASTAEEARVESPLEVATPPVSGAVFSIQRATFVQESQDSSASSHDSSSVNCRQQVAELVAIQAQEDSNSSLADSDKVPSADLSSIFEANVRREIEKFETHSVAKRSLGGKLANKNALTEWRIAEEIRLFNEREMELKRRFIGKTVNNQLADSSCSLNQQATEINGKPASRQNESVVVRFGKTLQLPKTESPGSGNQLSKSLKLSTSATSTPNNHSSNGLSQTPTTMISMHKFIVSGGKRLVYTNSHKNANQNTNGSLNSLQMNQQLTKSMSNLSTNRQSSEPARTVDYKAADSLKCKETPNVRMGLTRKVIETFSRMNHKNRENHQMSDSQSALIGSGTATVRQLAHQQSNNLNQQVSPSAEWKIQEELREMRAREAELLSQRNRFVKQSAQIGSLSKNGSATVTNDKGRVVKDGLSGELENNNNNNSEDLESQAQEDQRNRVGGGAETKLIDRLSFSSESLYPIKQTIDSFRKLNSSSQANNTSTPLQLNGNTNEIQRKLLAERQCNNDNYDSRVGGQRRKIPMIERWENNKLH